MVDTHRFASLVALSALPAQRLKWLKFQYPLYGVGEKAKMCVRAVKVRF